MITLAHHFINSRQQQTTVDDPFVVVIAKIDFISFQTFSNWFQVYRSQLERVSESWREKIGSFEKINAGLQSSCNELQQENDDLKYQVREVTQKQSTFEPTVL